MIPTHAADRAPRTTRPGARRAALAALVFLAALGLLSALYSSSPLLYDNDSYYHLAIARAQAEEGFDHELPWIRKGLLAEGFGDKEVLFHRLLAPFVEWLGPLAGGRVALALLGALLTATVAWLAMRAVGPWGVVVPFWMIYGSLELSWRLVRLRPELLSLLLLLLALWAAARRRHLALGLLGALYALSYTAVHAFVGLFGIVAALASWSERRLAWRLVLFPAVGAAVGLLAHPHFPHNLRIWWFQAFEFFRFKEQLDVGTEIGPATTEVALLANLAWWLGLAVLWRSRHAVAAGEAPAESEAAGGGDRARAAQTFAVAAAVFGTLYLMMSRFALYFVPFATLALLFEIGRTGGLGKRFRLPVRGAVPLAAAAVLVFLAGLPGARQELGRYRFRNAVGPENGRLVERQAFAARLPAGATVVAPWRQTPVYMLWAPQGRYLNVLDPGFLAVGDPRAHRLQAAIFDGTEPDVPLVAGLGLESDYVALSLVTAEELARRRLMADDPRIVVEHRWINGLFRIVAGANERFMLDWRVGPVGALPTATAAEVAEWPAYPRLSDPRGRALEGFVDLTRVPPVSAGCRVAARLERLESAERVRWELAPQGPTQLRVDGRLVADLGAGAGAVLGGGLLLELALDGGEHLVALRTCVPGGGGRLGFYLLRR